MTSITFKDIVKFVATVILVITVAATVYMAGLVIAYALYPHDPTVAMLMEQVAAFFRSLAS